ncbi:MupG family TIM beta-alpha barrel fold protein [Bacillus sp. SD-4]|nr:MupG family TIM beta-alpha barrel fold protein [Bacillus sp. SD-4]
MYLGQPLDEAYIKRMIKQGYQMIFTSVQIPEEDDETKYHYFTKLLNLLKHEQVTYLIDANRGNVTETHTCELPEDAGERQMFIIDKKRQTPKKYPRKPGTPNKTPLLEK